MNRRNLEEILNAHSEALSMDQDNAQQLLGAHADDAPELSSLLSLASSLKSVMVPQDPGTYKDFLRNQLMSQSSSGALSVVSNSRRRLSWGFVAVAGSLLSIIGLAILLIRRLRTAATQKAQTAASTAWAVEQ